MENKAEIIPILKPYPIQGDFANFSCSCSFEEKSEHKKDCFFYEGVRDMGATIPTCNYYAKLGYCPCNECKKYISSDAIFEMAKEKADLKDAND